MKPKLVILKVYSDCGTIVLQLARNAAFAIQTEDLENNPKCVDWGWKPMAFWEVTDLGLFSELISWAFF